MEYKVNVLLSSDEHYQHQYIVIFDCDLLSDNEILEVLNNTISRLKRKNDPQWRVHPKVDVEKSFATQKTKKFGFARLSYEL